jgi:hypothetical protein
LMRRALCMMRGDAVAATVRAAVTPHWSFRTLFSEAALRHFTSAPVRSVRHREPSQTPPAPPVQPGPDTFDRLASYYFERVRGLPW